jgi:ubiquinone/menaquinone biosynthesis C-methylase UbiE
MTDVRAQAHIDPTRERTPMTDTLTDHGWQLTEDSAAAYERYLVPLLFDRAASELLDFVGVEPGERVLDLACGTGAVTRHAARRVAPGGQVIAIDVNPGMLAVAERAAMPADGGGNVRLEEARAEALPLPDASIDVACCQQGLQFVTDRAAALAELHRVTAPGGRLALSLCRDLAHQPAYRRLVDALGRHVGADAAKGMASPFSLGDTEEIRGLVHVTGFSDIEVRITVRPLRVASPESFLRGETASSPLGEVVAALDPDVIATLLDDLTESLEPHTDDFGLSFPFETLVVTARR